MAEKAIPDGSSNTAVRRLDEALKYTIELLAEAGKKVKPKDEAMVKSGLSIVHDMVEANGTLSPAKE